MAITLSGTSGITTPGATIDANSALTLGANTALTFSDSSTLPSATLQPIYPVSASVASGSMTVTLNPCAIAFRSSTLTSGANSTVTVASAITLTIPAGATLGSTNGNQSDVVIVAINNAGTVELAVVIGVGDESGVISTTAISGSSTSANTYYSTSSRSNVAYCAVGMVSSTQTTAGTWNTSPSLVQGYRSSPNSIGYGQTWQNMLSPSVLRANNTTYTNTTGKPIMVAITTSTGNGSASFYINNVVVATQGGDYNNTNTFTFIIPSGNTYKISNGLSLWWELR